MLKKQKFPNSGYTEKYFGDFPNPLVIASSPIVKAWHYMNDPADKVFVLGKRFGQTKVENQKYISFSSIIFLLSMACGRKKTPYKTDVFQNI